MNALGMKSFVVHELSQKYITLIHATRHYATRQN